MSGNESQCCGQLPSFWENLRSAAPLRLFGDMYGLVSHLMVWYGIACYDMVHHDIAVCLALLDWSTSCNLAFAYLFTNYYLLLTTYHLPLIILHSPLSTCHPLFTIYFLPLNTFLRFTFQYYQLLLLIVNYYYSLLFTITYY